MDFSYENNLSFEAGAYDSILYPVINFNELHDYPKRYIVTPNPTGNDPEMVVMNNASVKAMRSIERKPIYSRKIVDNTSPRKPHKNTMYSDEDDTRSDSGIIRNNVESFTGLFDKDDRIKWLLFSILIIFVSLIMQTFNVYTNNTILKNMIDIQLLKATKRDN